MYLIIGAILSIAVWAYLALRSKTKVKGKGSTVGREEPTLDGKEDLHDFKKEE